MVILTRRNFLKAAAGTAIGAGAVGLCYSLNKSSKIASGQESLKANIEVSKSNVDPKVVIARNEDLVKGKKIDKELARKMIDDAVMKVTDAKSAADAWSRLFKGDDVVGIKVNCLAGKKLSPHPDIVDCLVEGLKTAGVKEGNIRIWERTRRELEAAGFHINTRGPGARCFGTDQLNYAYESEPEIRGSIGSLFDTVLSRYCTAIINVPVLKDHDLAGVSIGMKNFFGCIHNPNKYHDNNCDPYIADLNTHPYIRDKLRLIVCDAITVQYNGGPAYKHQWAWDFRGLLIGRDPVALDKTGADIIETKRKEAKLRSLKEVGREPKYIQTAAKLGLGVADRDKIEVIHT